MEVIVGAPLNIVFPTHSRMDEVFTVESVEHKSVEGMEEEGELEVYEEEFVAEPVEDPDIEERVEGLNEEPAFEYEEDQDMEEEEQQQEAFCNDNGFDMPIGSPKKDQAQQPLITSNNDNEEFVVHKNTSSPSSDMSLVDSNSSLSSPSKDSVGSANTSIDDVLALSVDNIRAELRYVSFHYNTMPTFILGI